MTAASRADERRLRADERARAKEEAGLRSKLGNTVAKVQMMMAYRNTVENDMLRQHQQVLSQTVDEVDALDTQLYGAGGGMRRGNGRAWYSQNNSANNSANNSDDDSDNVAQTNRLIKKQRQRKKRGSDVGASLPPLAPPSVPSSVDRKR
jgi:hypothetical protein